MPHDLDPLLLFSTVAVLSTCSVWFHWRTNRGVAILAAGLAGFSALCLAYEEASRAVHASIRVDLLFTIPIVTVAGIVVGVAGIRRQPMAGRIAGALLIAVSIPAFAWYSWATVQTAFKVRDLTRTSDQARRLYSEETLLCEGNLNKRFGPIGERQDACFGNLAVISRKGSNYPFARAIVNNERQLYLLFNAEPGIEDNWMLDDGPVARLEAGAGEALGGERLVGNDRTRVELHAAGAGLCEARIDRNGRIDILTLKKTALPPCEEPTSGPVRFAGAWGAITSEPNGLRRLTQMWLWDIGGTARGLLLKDLAPGGMRRDFDFVRMLRGGSKGENRWELNLDGEPSEPPFTFALSGGQARITGTWGETLLEPKEFAHHPKIALAPTRDRERFLLYFDSVFSNLNVPWTAPR